MNIFIKRLMKRNGGERGKDRHRERESRDKDGWINRIIYLSASVEKCRNVQGIIPDSF